MFRFYSARRTVDDAVRRAPGKLLRQIILLAFGTLMMCAHAENLSEDQRAAAREFSASQNIPQVWQDTARSNATEFGRLIRAHGLKTMEGGPTLDEQEKSRRTAMLDSLAAEASSEMAEGLMRMDADALATELAVTIYAPRFSAEELRELARFYASPAGQKMQRASPRTTLQRFTMDSFIKLLGMINKNEFNDILAFSQSPVSRKLRTLTPEINRDIERFYDAQTQGLVGSLTGKYTARVDAAMQASDNRQ